jgi:hypothetical protein
MPAASHAGRRGTHGAKEKRRKEIMNKEQGIMEAEGKRFKAQGSRSDCLSGFQDLKISGRVWYL